MSSNIVDPLDLREKRVEKAALDNAKACPVCGREMQPVYSCDIPALICVEHRVVLPELEDKE